MSFRFETPIDVTKISVVRGFGETPRAIALKVTAFQRIVLASIFLSFFLLWGGTRSLRMPALPGWPNAQPQESD